MKYESYEEYDEERFGTTGGPEELKKLNVQWRELIFLYLPLLYRDASQRGLGGLLSACLLTFLRKGDVINEHQRCYITWGSPVTVRDSRAGISSHVIAKRTKSGDFLTEIEASRWSCATIEMLSCKGGRCGVNVSVHYSWCAICITIFSASDV